MNVLGNHLKVKSALQEKFVKCQIKTIIKYLLQDVIIQTLQGFLQYEHL